MDAPPPNRSPSVRAWCAWRRAAAGLAACGMLWAQAGADDGAKAPADLPSEPLTAQTTASPATAGGPISAPTVVTVFTSAYLEAADAIAGLTRPARRAPHEAPDPTARPDQRQRPSPARPAQLAPGQDCAPRAQDYPANALRLRATGVTRLRIAVDATGQAAKVEIVRSAGTTRAHAALDEEAARRLVTCRFEPAHDSQGQPMRADFEAEVVWTLP